MLRLTGEEDKTGRSVDRTEDTRVCDSCGMRRVVESANKRAEPPAPVKSIWRPYTAARLPDLPKLAGILSALKAGLRYFVPGPLHHPTKRKIVALAPRLPGSGTLEETPTFGARTIWFFGLVEFGLTPTATQVSPFGLKATGFSYRVNQTARRAE